MNMRRLATICVASLSLSSMISSAAFAYSICPDGVPVDGHLNWALTDTGHNEGAGCGLALMGGLAGVEIPAEIGLLGAGEVFKRDVMMRAALSAFKQGYRQQAIDASICSQVHNQAAHECLKAHQDEVAQWLQTH